MFFFVLLIITLVAFCVLGFIGFRKGTAPSDPADNYRIQRDRHLCPECRMVAVNNQNDVCKLCERGGGANVRMI